MEKSNGYRKILRVGAANGGYIAACYAERYPNGVEVLFLAVSGNPDEPKGWSESLKEKVV